MSNGEFYGETDSEIRESLRYFGNLTFKQQLAIEELTQQNGLMRDALSRNEVTMRASSEVIETQRERIHDLLGANKLILQGVN